LRDLQCPLKQRVRGMDMQMDETDIVKNARHKTLLIERHA
jgi:hypothetical protein